MGIAVTVWSTVSNVSSKKRMISAEGLEMCPVSMSRMVFASMPVRVASRSCVSRACVRRRRSWLPAKLAPALWKMSDVEFMAEIPVSPRA